MSARYPYYKVILTGGSKITSKIKSHCSTGKVIHKSRISAEFILNSIKDFTMEVYKCRECKGYHLGHKKQKK